MRNRFLINTLGFSAALLVAASAAAQSVSLKPKFTSGRTDFLELVEDVDQSMKGGMAGPDGMSMKIKQAFVVKRAVDAAEKDKARIKFTYDRILSGFDAPMMAIDYDSDSKNNDVDAAPYEDVYKIVLGESVVAEVGPDGRTTNVSGMKNIIAKVEEKVSNNPFWAQIKSHMSDDSFGVQMVNARFGLLPDKEVKPGDTWTATLREKMPGMGTLVRELKCTLKGVDKKDGHTIATIEYEGKVSSEASKNPEDDVNAMGMSAKVESGETKGQAEFDVDAGDFVRSQADSKMNLAIAMRGAPEGDGGMKVSAKSKSVARVLSEKERSEQKKANAEKPAEKPKSAETAPPK